MGHDRDLGMASSERVVSQSWKFKHFKISQLPNANLWSVFPDPILAFFINKSWICSCLVQNTQSPNMQSNKHNPRCWISNTRAWPVRFVWCVMIGIDCRCTEHLITRASVAREYAIRVILPFSTIFMLGWLLCSHPAKEQKQKQSECWTGPPGSSPHFYSPLAPCQIVHITRS